MGMFPNWVPVSPFFLTQPTKVWDQAWRFRHHKCSARPFAELGTWVAPQSRLGLEMIALSFKMFWNPYPRNARILQRNAPGLLAERLQWGWGCFHGFDGVGAWQSKATCLVPWPNQQNLTKFNLYDYYPKPCQVWLRSWASEVHPCQSSTQEDIAGHWAHLGYRSFCTIISRHFIMLKPARIFTNMENRFDSFLVHGHCNAYSCGFPCTPNLGSNSPHFSFYL